MKNSKQWCIGFLLVTLLLMTLTGGLTAWIDPYFHYRAPREELAYPIYIPRYQNDGIGKHFSYDAIITGTSMTENFLASELDILFDVDTIKIPFSGAPYKEVNDNLARALQANPDVKMVVRCLDGYMLFEDKDTMRTDAEYPRYLYDENVFNDIEYLLNKETFFDDTLGVLKYTAEGEQTTNFDDYCYWGDLHVYSAEILQERYDWLAASAEEAEPDRTVLSQEEAEIVKDNVLQNAAKIAQENPTVQFYYYFPPYSLGYWFECYREGSVTEQIEAYAIASEILLQNENVHLFSFCDDYETVMNLDNYKDQEHHSPQINSKILKDMREGNFELHKDSCEDYWKKVRDFYLSLDYHAFFREIYTQEK